MFERADQDIYQINKDRQINIYIYIIFHYGQTKIHNNYK